jgi:transcriptional regulator with GAF, ATPase, and Fis domain
MGNLEAAHTITGGSTIIASPNDELRTYIRENCARQECDYVFTTGGAEALSLLEQRRHKGFFLDRRLRDLDVREVISVAESLCPGLRLLVFDSETGALDSSQVTTPESLSAEQARLVDALRAFRQPSQDLQGPALQTGSADEDEELLPCMVGRSSAIKRTAQLVKLVASRSTTILLIGESGTGKELVAKAIHNLGPRAPRPFVVINCAAIPEALFESELFGYNRGAFTGAVESRLGRIHAAHGGTLFLDEVGELPRTVQAKLLRFLQEGEVQRLGSPDVFRVDVRVIAATNSDLTELVIRRQFREDLFYRLMVFPIELDPLRDRPDDIGPLCEFFLAGLAAESGEPKKTLSPGALRVLEEYEWRGNVRELQHAIERAFILAHDSQSVLAEHFRLQPSPQLSKKHLLEDRAASLREPAVGKMPYASYLPA